MNPKFPKPDWSSWNPIEKRDPESGVLDIGSKAGVLKDGRTFRAEFWEQDEVWMRTFFFSTLGLEDSSEQDIARLLVSENLVEFMPDRRCIAILKIVDDSGNEMWSVNVAVGDAEGGPFVEGGRTFWAFS